MTLCKVDDIIMSQKRKGQTPRDVKQGLYKGREPILILKGWRTKPNDTGERGESNGIRRNILPVRGTRRGAVTETIKVIAEKMSEFQFHNLNRLKSAIGF